MASEAGKRHRSRSPRSRRSGASVDEAMADAAPAAPAEQGVMSNPDMMLGMQRSMVTMMQFNEQKQDYTNSIANLDENTEEYKQALAGCHERGASKCVQVANIHRGLYVKAAQFICSLRGGTGDRGVPSQYSEALKTFTDHAPHKSASQISPVLKECMNLGEWPETPLDSSCSLKSIEETPVASASLAQVHKAVLQDGTPVAVKVQYPELRKEMASDFAVFKNMGAQIKAMSAGYDLMWIVEDFEKNLTHELDFRLEADAGEATAEQLKHLWPSVFVPKVYREFSSERVLTMEYCDGLLKVTDPEGLRAAGLDPEECASLICDTFAEMIFVHGRVHADPHAGNIYIRPIPQIIIGGGTTQIRQRPQLVLLDHGLYYDLNTNDVRLYFCKYWQACCCKDSETMSTIGQRFAGSLKRFLPLILSPWFIFGGSGVSLGEVIAASKGQLPDSVGLRDVADFVMATREGGANLIGLLHSLGYTRGLLEALPFSEARRLESMMRYAIVGESFDSTQEVPRELTNKERAWVRWRVGVLGCHIAVMAPIAGPLIRYAKAEQAPPMWAVVSAPVVLAFVGMFVSRWYKVGSTPFALK